MNETKINFSSSFSRIVPDPETLDIVAQFALVHRANRENNENIP